MKVKKISSEVRALVEKNLREAKGGRGMRDIEAYPFRLKVQRRSAKSTPPVAAKK